MTKTPTGQEISIEINSGVGTAELVRGSMRKLRLEDGDLLVVRVDARVELRHTVRALFSDLVEQTGKRAVAVIIPLDYEIESMTHAQARDLLDAILERKPNP